MGSWRLVMSVEALPHGLGFAQGPTLVPADKVPQEVRKAASNVDYWCKHVIESVDGQVAILERYSSDYWVEWRVLEDRVQELALLSSAAERASPFQLPRWEYLKKRKLFELWREDKSLMQAESDVVLEMTPPDYTQNSLPAEKPVDPKTYLVNKYYEALFAIHMPLAYFVKSNLSRFRNICYKKDNANGKLISTMCLASIFCEIQVFDQKYIQYRILKENLDNTLAHFSRESCLKKYNILLTPSSVPNGSMADLLTVLKAREIKLQIIILLELINMNNLDNMFEHFDDNYKKKLKKRALNVSKRGFVPLAHNLNSKDFQGEIQLDYCEQLDLYLDKLMILDILLASEPPSSSTDPSTELQEHRLNILNKNREASSVGFINFVLIPYYTKKVSHAVRFIAHKLKDPNLHKRKPHAKQSRSLKGDNTEVIKLSRTSSKVTSTPSSPLVATHPSLRRTSTVSTLTPELLSSREGSSLNTFFGHDNKILRKNSFLSRTKSDLSMHNLQRRQLSIQEFSSKTRHNNSSAMDTTTTQDNLLVNVQGVASFRRVGKSSTVTEPKPHIASIEGKEATNVIEVTATPQTKNKKTPIKIPNLHSIVESPLACTPLNTSKSNVPNNARDEKQSQENTKKKIRRRLFAP